jgi:hypothetical protein
MTTISYNNARILTKSTRQHNVTYYHPVFFLTLFSYQVLIEPKLTACVIKRATMKIVLWICIDLLLLISIDSWLGKDRKNAKQKKTTPSAIKSTESVVKAERVVFIK